MRRFLRWLKAVNAFRIGLATGLVFAAVHVLQIAGRAELPLLTRMEDALVDLRFKQRYQFHPLRTSGRVVVAAVDELAIAKYGRFPWDRRVDAALIDKLNAQGVSAIGFDISFSDEDLGGQFAGAKRYRKRFEDISLAAPRNQTAVERFSEADSDLAGAASALLALGTRVKPGAEPIYKTAKGRLEDGRSKVIASKEQFDQLIREHHEYAAELDHDLTGLDPDTVMGEAVKRAGSRIAIGWVALTEPEMKDFKPEDAEEHVRRIERSRLHDPEFRYPLQGGGEGAQPVKRSWIKEYAGLRAPLAPIAASTQWFGFFNALPDHDGVIRHEPLAVQVKGRYLPALSAAMAAIALGVKPSEITPVTTNAEDGEIDSVDIGGKRLVPTDGRGLIEINYFGPQNTFVRWSIADIMDGKYDAELKDKLVLVAATAQGTFDQRVTPMDKIVPGIETHANTIETILSRRYLVRGPLVQTVEIAVLFGMALLFALFFSKVKVNYSLPLLCVSTTLVWAAVTLAFWAGYNTFAALPLLELGAMFVLVTVYRYATEERDKRQLRKAFQLYLNPEVMEELLDEPEKLALGGKEMELTVMFSDIRGFTAICEALSATEVVHLLNAYLSPMTDIVLRRLGTLDKYIGDAVMAFFGAPVPTESHAANCCDSALEMMETLARLRERWRIEDPEMPHIDIGIGINSGPMVVGNMGSSQRFNYTVMGDNVNTASRLEGLNKEFGTHILISEQTLQSARKGLHEESAYCVRELDFVAVQGKKEPVRLFELRSRGPAATSEMPLLSGYAEGLRLYRARKFAEAQLQFESMLQRFPEDGPSALFVRRCEQMTESPPGEKWDGVYRMAHK
ncbi:MAG: adenylate/guanylate cyclase domain-containing protein [Deltaproteobacteria bacterium]|nr:MAG: adenylate/guanylate cyclase domain-containing protein [Deltaproteobacteria bacterium]